MPLVSDPLALAPNEVVSAVELCPGAAPYLPLRTWRDRELQGQGTDPILGVLAALSHIDSEMRVVAQLSLLPMKPIWSLPHRRMTVEHPLEPERQHQMEIRSHSAAPSTGAIVGMGLVVAIALLKIRYQSLLPHG